MFTCCNGLCNKISLLYHVLVVAINYYYYYYYYRLTFQACTFTTSSQSLSKPKLVHGKIIRTTYYYISEGVLYQGPIR
jgi:hypothetical protein